MEEKSISIIYFKYRNISLPEKIKAYLLPNFYSSLNSVISESI